MKNEVMIASALLFAVGLVDATVAQATKQKPAEPAKKVAETTATEETRELVVRPMQKLAGMKVEDARGVEFARLEDAFLVAGGKIGYGVLATERDDKFIVIPWELVKLRGSAAEQAGGAEPTLRVELDIARMKEAPTFDATRWPTTPSDPLFAEVQRFYAAPKPVDVATNSRGTILLRATKIAARAVESTSGEKIGELRALIVDPNHGRANYVALELAEANGPSTKTVAMPWESLTVTREGDRERITTAVAKERLAAAPEFRGEAPNWKEMSDPAWIGKLYTHFGVRPYWNVEATPHAPPTEKP